MAYIGRQLARGENKLFDDISSSFNGSTTVFNLTVSSVATSTATPYQLFVSLGGVMQKPNTDFTTAGNQITFTTAPAAGLSCWIMMQGDTIDQAAIPDASVTPSKISGSNFAFSGDLRLKDADGSHYVGFASPTTVSTNKVWTLPAADGSASQYLQTNGSGVLGWATVSVGGATGIDFNDDVHLRFGAGNDLDIYHQSAATLNRIIGTSATNVQCGNLNITDAAGSMTFANFAANGSKLYHNGAIKLQTTTDGLRLRSANDTTATLYFEADDGDDNADHWREIAQTNGNFEIQSKSTGSWASIATFAPAGLTVPGNLTVSGTTTTINTQTLDVEDKNVVIGKVSSPSDTTADGGGWTLKGATDKTFNWVNSTDAWTSSEHIHLGDNKKLLVGTDSDLQIYSDNTDTYISNTTNTTLLIRNLGNAEIAIKPQNSFPVELYFNASKKLETTSGGINVTGAINVNGSALASGNSIDLVADGAIGAGKPVLLTTAGKVTAVQAQTLAQTPQGKSVSNIPSNITGFGMAGIWHETSDKGLIMYRSGTNTSATLKYRQYRLDSGGSITNIDTETGAAGAYPRDMKLIMDPDIDKPIMCWGMSDGYFYTRSVTIDGNGANHAQASTQGSSASIAAPQDGWDICYDTNANIFVLVHRDPVNGGGSVRLGYQTEPASGQHKIVWITTVYQFDADPETPRCVFDTVNNKVIIAFGDGGGHDVGALIGTVSGTGSSATISLGSTAAVYGPGPNKPEMAWHASDGVAGFFFQNKNNNQNQLITLKTSGTSVHFNDPVQVGSENADAMAIWYNSNTSVFQWSVKGRVGWISATGTPTSGGSGSSAATVGSGQLDLSTWLGANIGDFEPSQGANLPEHPLVTQHFTTQGGAGGDKLKLITLTVGVSSSNASASEKLIGFAESAISDGNTGTIKLHGNVVGNQSSLTVGSQYYIQADGTIGTVADNTIGNVKAGTAVSATKLIICDPRV